LFVWVRAGCRRPSACPSVEARWLDGNLRAPASDALR
jgi:hypothetical protein